MALWMMASTSATKSVLNRIAGCSIVSRASAGRWVDQPQPSASDTVSSLSESESSVALSKTEKELRLRRQDAAPKYAVLRPSKCQFQLEKSGPGGELRANYALFDAAIEATKLPWNTWTLLTSEERDVASVHMKAVKERRLAYQDPFTDYTVFTVSQLLYNGECCGNGCRHCPYGMENAPEDVRKTMIWNGAFYV